MFEIQHGYGARPRSLSRSTRCTVESVAEEDSRELAGILPHSVESIVRTGPTAQTWGHATNPFTSHPVLSTWKRLWLQRALHLILELQHKSHPFSTGEDFLTWRREWERLIQQTEDVSKRFSAAAEKNVSALLLLHTILHDMRDGLTRLESATSSADPFKLFRGTATAMRGKYFEIVIQLHVPDPVAMRVSSEPPSLMYLQNRIRPSHRFPHSPEGSAALYREWYSRLGEIVRSGPNGLRALFNPLPDLSRRLPTREVRRDEAYDEGESEDLDERLPSEGEIDNLFRMPSGSWVVTEVKATLRGQRGPKKYWCRQLVRGGLWVRALGVHPDMIKYLLFNPGLRAHHSMEQFIACLEDAGISRHAIWVFPNELENGY